MNKFDFGPYTVKNVQTFNTPDGGGYNCTLYRKGKRVATCHQAGHGGSVNVYFEGEGREARLKEQKLFLDHLATLPEQELGPEFPEGGTFSVDADMFIAEIVDREVERRWFRRNCKNKVLFRIKGDKPGTWRTIASPWSERVEAHLKAKHGDQLEEVANLTRC